MRLSLRALVLAMALVVVVPAGTAGAEQGGSPPDRETTLEWQRAGLQQVPKATPSAAAIADPAAATGVNPYLALVTDPAAVDWAYWRAVASAQGELRAAAQPRSANQIGYEELEPDDVHGQNDSLATAELVRGFTTSGEAQAEPAGFGQRGRLHDRPDVDLLGRGRRIDPAGQRDRLGRGRRGRSP